jgi:hypothetical protein
MKSFRVKLDEDSKHSQLEVFRLLNFLGYEDTSGIRNETWFKDIQNNNSDYGIRWLYILDGEIKSFDCGNAGSYPELPTCDVTKPTVHIITIDDKKIELSEESYQSLKEQLT